MSEHKSKKIAVGVAMGVCGVAVVTGLVLIVLGEWRGGLWLMVPAAALYGVLQWFLQVLNRPGGSQ